MSSNIIEAHEPSGSTNLMRTSGASLVISFDDIQILIANKTQEFYLRKSFNWTSPFNSELGIANILSDDYAALWLNGHRIDADSTPHPDQYWNRRGKIARGSWLRNGTNVVAAKVSNNHCIVNVSFPF